MEENILFENYLKSLEQKYNAVCFDKWWSKIIL